MTNNRIHKSHGTKVAIFIFVMILIMIFACWDRRIEILFLLDARYWPDWVPRILWIAVAVMALNGLVSWNFERQRFKAPSVNVTTESVSSQTVETGQYVTYITRFVLFALFVEAWRQSGHSLAILFYPFVYVYRILVMPYTNYFDFGMIPMKSLGVKRITMLLLPLPVTLIVALFIFLMIWYLFARAKGVSLRRFCVLCVHKLGHFCVRICRCGVVGQIPLFFVMYGLLYIAFLLVQWSILAFYSKPLEFYLHSGVLSSRLIVVPLLIIALLVLTFRLFRKKKQLTIVLLCFASFGQTACFAQENATVLVSRLSFDAVPEVYPQAKQINDHLYLLKESGIEHRQKSEVDKAINEESKKADDGGFLANPTAVNCFAAYAYRYTGGRYKNEAITFRLRTPDKIEPEKTYPLIVHLHGKGESNDDNERQIAHMQSTLECLTGPKSLDCFILSPHCPSDNKDWQVSLVSDEKGDSPLAYTKEIIDAVCEVFPINTNRISIIGVCSGSNGAWDLAAQYPDLFCALAATTISLPASPERLGVLKHIPMWPFNNDNDKSSPIEPLYEARDILKDLGASVYLTVRKNGHDSWTKAFKDDKIFVWLAAQQKESLSPPPGFVLHCSRTWLEVGWQILLPLLLIIIIGLFQRKISKLLQPYGVQ